MAFLLQEGQNFLFRDADGLVGNLIDQIRLTHFGSTLNQALPDLVFQDLRHPDHPQKAAITDDELALGDVELGVTHKSRGRRAAAHDTGQGGELHAAGGLARIVPVNRHDPVARGQHRRDALAAAAGGHGVDDHGVEVVVGDGPAGSLVDEVVDPLPLPQLRVQAFALLDQAVSRGYWKRDFLESDEGFVGLRSDPRFTAIIEKAGQNRSNR